VVPSRDSPVPADRQADRRILECLPIIHVHHNDLHADGPSRNTAELSRQRLRADEGSTSFVEALGEPQLWAAMTHVQLEIADLSIRFGGIRALDGASFAIQPGITTGLIGPNGAGKTTLFNCISGLTPGATGRVSFYGRDISREEPQEISRAGLVRSFQLARGCKNMTVFEHLMLYGPRQRGEGLLGALLGNPEARRQEEALREEALDMAPRLKLAHDAADLLSG